MGEGGKTAVGDKFNCSTFSDAQRSQWEIQDPESRADLVDSQGFEPGPNTSLQPSTQFRKQPSSLGLPQIKNGHHRGWTRGPAR